MTVVLTLRNGIESYNIVVHLCQKGWGYKDIYLIFLYFNLNLFQQNKTIQSLILKKMSAALFDVCLCCLIQLCVTCFI